MTSAAAWMLCTADEENSARACQDLDFSASDPSGSPVDRYVVTGAFGYSGKYIATRLLAEGHAVRFTHSLGIRYSSELAHRRNRLQSYQEL